MDRFFEKCRVHGIAFDSETLAGPAFMLCGSLTAGEIGVMCSARRRKRCLVALKRTLAFVRDQIGEGFAKGEFTKGSFGEIEFDIGRALRAYENA